MRWMILAGALLVAAPVGAQEASDRQLRQRVDFAISRTENSIDELGALLSHLRALYDDLHARIVADSIAGLPEPEPEPGIPGTVNDLRVTDCGTTWCDLAWTEVDDGTGAPAGYEVRYDSEGRADYFAWPIVSEGSCAFPVVGSAVGQTIACRVEGLAPSTDLSFQLRACRDCTDTEEAGMAIVHDATTVNDGGNASSSSYTHTCTGSDLALVVGVAASGSADVTGVTYGGVAMTALGAIGAPNGRGVIELFILVGPATGANTVAVTLAGAAEHASVARSYTGVDQTTPHGTPVTGSGNDTNPNVVVSSAAGELVVDAAFLDAAPETPAVGSGQTQRANLDFSAGDHLLASEEAGAESVTMSWAFGVDGRRWASIGVALKPATGGGGGETGSIAAAAAASATFGAVATVPAGFEGAAQAGDAPTALGQAVAAISAAATASDAWAAVASAFASLVEEAVAAGDVAALAQAGAVLAEGATAADAWEGSDAPLAALTAAAAADEAFAASAEALASFVAAAQADEQMAASAQAAASWSAGAVASDLWSARAIATAAWSAGAHAAEAFAGSSAPLIGRVLSATLTVLTVHHRTVTVQPQQSATRTLKTTDTSTI